MIPVAQSGRKFSRAIWLPILIAALGIGLAGVTKFAQRTRWEALFDGWGYPRPFALIIGAVEILGGVALLVPRLSAYAATMLAIVMAGALFTLMMHPAGPLGRGATPGLYLALLIVIALQRWPQRRLPMW